MKEVQTAYFETKCKTFDGVKWELIQFEIEGLNGNLSFLYGYNHADGHESIDKGYAIGELYHSIMCNATKAREIYEYNVDFWTRNF